MVRNKVKREPEYIEDVEIIDAGAEGMSVAKPEGRVVFIPFGVPGDVVDIEVYKRRPDMEAMPMGPVTSTSWRCITQSAMPLSISTVIR